MVLGSSFVLPQSCVNTFESISVQLSMGNIQDIIFHTLYRPPNVFKADFIGEFITFVECAAFFPSVSTTIPRSLTLQPTFTAIS